ncbi:deoxyribose-phosphate aldolase [Muriicola jejuensis]|uniref:Deoxyribose-phosphate aldolase n=1 Tax=Muriicola jejuensis TaxID=504488 RepID=A0A6P0UD52_9FLAO|nr:deoxyribose-phosphate aldolase [Muriicola jejuensis]NER09598.1 deoxyribose-phosphate aldolase [Muriicola jejuensis]SMP07504.1 deoxyribose-phosphate aldolase [Muriicola jejuensis]
MKPLNTYIDHTLLKSTATVKEINTLCKEAKDYAFYAVCVNSGYLPLAKNNLLGSGVKLAAVIGFPLGAMSTESKIGEVRYCLEHGTDEIDMVMNLGWLRSGMSKEIVREIGLIKDIMGQRLLKVILEVAYLSEEEIRHACDCCIKGGADFVKTSTGFGPGGATLEAVRIMRESVGNKALIKASGGIRDKSTALEFIQAGASRIGTSSGVQMMKE